MYTYILKDILQCNSHSILFLSLNHKTSSQLRAKVNKFTPSHPKISKRPPSYWHSDYCSDSLYSECWLASCHIRRS